MSALFYGTEPITASKRKLDYTIHALIKKKIEKKGKTKNGGEDAEKRKFLVQM